MEVLICTFSPIRVYRFKFRESVVEITGVDFLHLWIEQTCAMCIFLFILIDPVLAKF